MKKSMICLKNPLEENKEKNRFGDGRARISELKLISAEGMEKKNFKVGESMMVRVKYIIQTPIKDVIFSFGIIRSDGLQCYGTNTLIDNIDNLELTESGQFDINIPNIELMPGEYTIDLGIEADLGMPADIYLSALSFEIFSDMADVGIVNIEHTWRF